MTRRRTVQSVLGVLLAVVCLVGWACAQKSGKMAQTSISANPPPTVATQPSPFQFDIEELTLKFADRVVLHDEFKRPGVLKPMEIDGHPVAPTEGPAYTVELGKIPAENVRDGVLRVDQNSTTNVWLGPNGTFGHRLHHHDVYITLVSLPLRASGQSTFVASEALPLEFSIRLRQPRLNGFEKLKIGLLDTEAFKNVAALGIGRLPLRGSTERPFTSTQLLPISPTVSATTVNLLDLVANPAIALNRVEEPDVMGEIVLDYADLPPIRQTDTVEMTLRIAANGRLSGLARVFEGGQVKEMRFEPKAQDAGDFIESRARIPLNTKLAATLYIETFPKPAVFRVEPKEVASGKLHGADKVRLRIEGIGFGTDTRVEMVPERAQGAPIAAERLQLERQPRGPEGTVLFADIGLHGARAETYSLRLTSGGQTAVLRNAVRIF